MAMLIRGSGGFDEDEVAIPVCLLTATLVPVCIPLLRRQPFTGWWSVQLLLFAIGLMLTILAEAVGMRGLGGMGILTPGTALFGALADHSHYQDVLIGGAFSGVLWSVAALIRAIREMGVYRGLEAEVDALKQPEPAALNDPA